MTADSNVIRHADAAKSRWLYQRLIPIMSLILKRQYSAPLCVSAKMKKEAKSTDGALFRNVNRLDAFAPRSFALYLHL